MGLNTTPISRNLRTSVRLFGLEIEDLLVLGLGGVGVLIVGQFIFPKSLTAFGMPMNWCCFFGVLLIGVPGLMIFKYGKPRGYLKDLIAWHTTPHFYSGLERDPEITGPYILELNDDKPNGDKQ